MKSLNSSKIAFIIGLTTLLFSIQVGLAFPAAQVESQSVLDHLPSIKLTLPDINQINAIAWKPDSSTLALAADKNIWLYSETLKQIGQLGGHTDQVFSVTWSPDGNKLASSGADNTIRIWDMRKGSTFETTEMVLKENNWVAALAWSPDGHKLASLVIDESIPPTNDGIFYVKTSIWNTSTWLLERTLPSAAGYLTLAWSPDSKLIANAGLIKGYGRSARLWDASNGEERFSFDPGGDTKISSLAFSPDGKSLAIGAEWPDLFIADLSIQDYSMFLSGIGAVVILDWKPDGSQIAAVDEQGRLGIWNAKTGQLLVNILNAHEGFIVGLAWNTSGTKLATLGLDDKTLRIWDVTSVKNDPLAPTATPAFATATPQKR